LKTGRQITTCLKTGQTSTMLKTGPQITTYLKTGTQLKIW